MKGESDYKMYSTANFHPLLISYPKHIALIPDGGRRWAKINGCSIKDSYSISMSLITQMIDFVFEQGTEYIIITLKYNEYTHMLSGSIKRIEPDDKKNRKWKVIGCVVGEHINDLLFTFLK